MVVFDGPFFGLSPLCLCGDSVLPHTSALLGTMPFWTNPGSSEWFTDVEGESMNNYFPYRNVKIPSEIFELATQLRLTQLGGPLPPLTGGKGEGVADVAWGPNVLRMKGEGNILFGAGDVAAAALAYSAAIDVSSECLSESGVNPSTTTISNLTMCYLNRALCSMKLGEFEKAQSDAARAVYFEATNVKAWFRLAEALNKLGKTGEARCSLKRCEALGGPSDSCSALGVEIALREKGSGQSLEDYRLFERLVVESTIDYLAKKNQLTNDSTRDGIIFLTFRKENRHKSQSRINGHI